MSSESSISLRAIAAVLIAVAFLAAGAGGTYLLMRGHQGSNMNSGIGVLPAAPIPQSPTANNAPLPDITIAIGDEAIKQAGIVVSPVTAGTSAAEIRLPGVVEPNAYRQVVITPLVSGRVTGVSAVLGQHVRNGQTIAEIYSPELAEAQTQYISARAELGAHERELQRTQRLVEIGAASRQELERVHAEHTAQTAEVENTRSKLELLGVPSSALDDLQPGKDRRPVTNVASPIDGVVTEREVNVGLNVYPATKLFTVVDLSTVWVIADVYEKDIPLVRVGTQASVTTTAYPDMVLRGRVSYIDPQLSTETRTAKVRVEVQNPRNQLRLGMYTVIVAPGQASAVALAIPRSAIQNVGDRHVVYLASRNAPATFVEREVRLGQTSGVTVEVLTGVQVGDAVVTEGSFFLRAERERLGLRTSPLALSGGH